MELRSLNDVFEAQLGDLYDAEKQLLVALPKMAGAAQADELREAFETHLQQTRNHVERLERVFSDLGMPMPSETCKAMQGLIAEGNQIVLASGTARGVFAPVQAAGSSLSPLGADAESGIPET